METLINKSVSWDTNVLLHYLSSDSSERAHSGWKDCSLARTSGNVLC